MDLSLRHHHLVVGPIMVETPYETERETEREDEDNHGGDDETENTGQSAQQKLIKLSAFWTELTSQYPRYSKLARKILNLIKLILESTINTTLSHWVTKLDQRLFTGLYKMSEPLILSWPGKMM